MQCQSSLGCIDRLFLDYIWICTVLRSYAISRSYFNSACVKSGLPHLMCAIDSACVQSGLPQLMCAIDKGQATLLMLFYQAFWKPANSAWVASSGRGHWGVSMVFVLSALCNPCNPEADNCVGCQSVMFLSVARDCCHLHLFQHA